MCERGRHAQGVRCSACERSEANARDLDPGYRRAIATLRGNADLDGPGGVVGSVGPIIIGARRGRMRPAHRGAIATAAKQSQSRPPSTTRKGRRSPRWIAHATYKDRAIRCGFSGPGEPGIVNSAITWSDSAAGTFRADAGASSRCWASNRPGPALVTHDAGLRV